MENRRFIFAVCAFLWGIMAVFAQGNTLSVPDVTVAPGRSIYLPIQIDNTSDIVGVQFTLAVKEGITLDTSTASLTERADGHSVRFSQIAANKYMAVVFSSENKPIIGRKGNLMTVKLTASSSLEEGSVSQMTLTDVVLGTPNGDNIVTGYSAGNVKCEKSPDLEVSDVSVSGSTISPQGKLSVSWKVSNIGGYATGDGWAERIILETSEGTVKELGTVYYDNSLNAGGVVSRNTDISLPFILGVSGEARIRVRLVGNKETGEPVGLQENNSSLSASTLTVENKLQLSPETVEVDEAEGKLLLFQLVRSGDVSIEESFDIAKGSETRVDLPVSITIPKGQSGVNFYAQLKANKVLDADSVVNITVSSASYASVSAQMLINDDVIPTLSIVTDAQDVTEGGTLKLKVSTERIINSDLVISLTCDNPNRFEIPSDIIIPAGKNEVDVVIKALDDEIPDVEKVVTFIASANNHNNALLNTVLVDNDVPTLTLSITPNAISEGAGPLAMSATLKRTDNIDKVVTVKFSDDSNGGIYYGNQTIVMEKGVEEVTVNLGPLDNAIVDGERSYNISAAVYIASCSCNAGNGHSGGIVSVPVTFYDNDGPTLTMNSPTSVLNEGGSLIVTLKRNTSNENDLVVAIASNQDDKVVYPKEVIIPAGKDEVPFEVTAKNNSETGDGINVILTATAPDYSSGNMWFAVSDQTLPDAQIIDIALSADEVVVSGTVNVSVTVLNSGTYPMPEQTRVKIDTGFDSGAYLYLQDALAPQETIVLTREISVPKIIGTYQIKAVVNDNKAVKELSINNNTSQLKSIKTLPLFNATVSTDKTVYKQGEKIIVTGKLSGESVSMKDVDVYFINNGARLTFNTKSDNNGNFTLEYMPYERLVGTFVVGACYPNEGLTDEMAKFNIYGVKRTSNSPITCEPIVGEKYSGVYSLVNPGNLALTGVKVDVLSKPDNCEVSVNCPSNVEAGETFEVGFDIDVISPSEGNRWQQIVLNLTTTEGATFPTTLYFYGKVKEGKLKTDIAKINTTMTKGKTRDYIFNITNVGRGGTGKITIELPSWMACVTPKEMSSIASGDTASVVIRLTPTYNMQLNVPVYGSIGLNCSNGEGLSLPYYIEPVSESTGTMIIDVCDQFTYYTDDAPHVKDAKVVIKHPATGEVIYEGVTDNNGIYQVELPEGFYNVTVTAEKHESYSSNLYVDPGRENKTVVDLGHNGVTYTWDVVPTEIEDEYKIVTKVEYETNVPVPCVIIDLPEKIDGDNMAIGDKTIVNMTVTNKGLVTALDVTLNMPENTDEWMFEPLVSIDPFDLPAQQSIVVPIQITKIGGANRAKAMNPARANIVQNFNSCMAVVSGTFSELCGKTLKEDKAVEKMAMKMCGVAATGATIIQFLGNLTGGNAKGGDFSLNNYITEREYFKSSSQSNNVSTGHILNLCDTCDTKKADALLDFFLDISGLSLANNVLNASYDGIDYVRDNKDKEQRDYYKKIIGENLKEGGIELYKAYKGEGFAGTYDIISTSIDIINILTEECPKQPSNNESTPFKANNNSSKQSWKDNYDAVALKVVDYLRLYESCFLEFFGDRIWFEGNMEEANELFDLLLNNDNVTIEQALSVKPQYATNEQVEKLYERILGTIDPIDWDKMQEYLNSAKSIDEESIRLGYSNIAEHYQDAYDKCVKGYEDTSSSVCASITLQFSQKMTMTRQAFRGTLTVFNGHDTEAMKDVKLTLEVKDEDGNMATSHEFQINPEKLTGFGGELNLNSGWTLDAGQTGVSTIMFIPTKYAAPTVEKRYAFGGTLSYVDPFTGLTVTRILAPVTLTVKPSPNLDLTYFMQRDIKGDDPLTLDVVEPCEEAEFSLLINNKGYGDATNVKMVTDQPKIIENEKGLLVDFELVSSQLNGEDKTLALGGSVTTDFGNIPAMSTAYAQWWIKSSLLGHFTEYNVEATHVTSYGNPDLSLLNDVTIHELVRSVDASTAQKNLVGFMVNDIIDAEDTPDMMYLSDGEIEAVSKVKDAVINRLDKTTYTLTISQTTSGWNYGNIIDPSYGLSELKKVVRNSDGKDIALRNFWQTDRTLRDGKDPLYENRIHFVDNLSSVSGETYTLTFEPLPELMLAVASIDGVPADGELSVEPLSGVTVVFNKPIDPASFTTDDITLAVQGVKQDVTKVDISTKDNKTFNIDFSQINETIGNGYFVFTVQTSDITDYEGYRGKDGKSASWIMFKDGLVTLNTESYPKSSGFVVKTPVNASLRASVVTAENSPVADNKAEYGSKVRMESVANDGYEFLNWTSDGEILSTEPVFEYIALNDVNIVANFIAKNYNVTIDYNEQVGNVIGSSSGYYAKGTELVFSAKAAEDYVFDGWIVNGESAGYNETLSITVDGSTVIKALFRKDIYHQDIILETGWNWISSYLNEPMQPELLYGGVKRLLSQTEEVYNDPELGMVGNIENILPCKAYKAQASYVTLKTLKGRMHNLDDNPMDVKQGWNWISYPYSEERPVSTVISNPEQGEFLVAQEGFAEYTDGQWQGTVDVMKPSAGYLYKSAKDKTIVFDFSKPDNDSPARIRYTDYSTNISEYVDIRKYPHTMNIIAEIQKDGETLENGYDVFAMVDNECRGVGKFINGRCYLTVYGEKTEPLVFVVKKAIDNEVLKISESLLFQNDVIGSTRKPFKMTVLDATGISNIPSEKTGFKSIHNMLGQKVKSIDRGGVYIINGKKVVVTKKNENDYSK